MSETLTQAFVDFFWPVVIAVPAGLLLLIIALPLAGDITWTQKRLKFLGIFYNLTAREQLWLAVGMVRLLFIAAVMFCWVHLAWSHMAFYAALFLAYNAVLFRARRVLVDIFNTAIIFVAMMLSNMVSGYYYDVSGDTLIMSVLVLLALFVTLYTAYFFFKDTCDVLEYKQTHVASTHFEPVLAHMREDAKL